MAEGGRCIRVIRTGETVHSLSWSPDGLRLAHGGGTGAVGVLSRQGERLWGKGLPGVWSVAWSPDGPRIAVALIQAGAVWVLHPHSGEELFRFPDEPRAQHVCWSPDGTRLAWGDGALLDRGRIRVVDFRAGSNPVTLRELDGWARRLCWSPDGSRLAAFLDQPHLRNFAVVVVSAAGELVTQWDVPWAESLCWVRGGAALAVVTGETAIMLHDVATGEVRGEYSTGRRISALAASACGRLMASGAADDAEVYLWLTEACGEALRLEGVEERPYALAFDPGGELLATAGYKGMIQIWDISDLLPPPSSPDRAGAAEAYLRRQALSVGRRPRGQGVSPGAWLPRLEGADEAAGLLGVVPEAGRLLGLSADGRTLFAADNNAKVRRWGLETGRFDGRLPEHPETVISWDIDLSPDGRRVAGIDYDVASAWDVTTGGRLWSSGRSDVRDVAVAWSPDGDRLVVGRDDGAVVVLDGSTGRGIAGRHRHELSVTGVCWSPDMRRVASSSDDGTVRAWVVGGPAESILVMRGHEGAVNAVGWSPDGRWIASCGDDRTVRIWGADSGDEVACCRGHEARALAVAWAPDSRRVASQSYDQTVRVWEAASGRELRCYPAGPTWVYRLRWAPSGAYLASNHSWCAAHLWDAREAGPGPKPGPAEGQAAPTVLGPLVAGVANLTRAGFPAPLGLLRDLCELAAGRPASTPLAPLVGQAGLAALARLRWPPEARLGLAALMLRRCSFPAEWLPPADLTPARLRQRLAEALTDADDVPPEHYPTPVAMIQAALADIDDRLLGLLDLVGPAAVAADPALPVRLLPHARVMPPGLARARPLAAALGDGGPVAAHPSPWGVGRTGLGTRGAWRSLLPWQLTLPGDVLAARQRRGELLYRCGEAREGGAAGPLVILLDVSPASYGPVEAVTRACASACAVAWQARGEAVWLVTAGGEGQVRELRSAADLPALWLARSGQPARAADALRAAERARRGLAASGPGCVLLLAHAQFGWGEEAPKQAIVRALFVHYPRDRAAPGWASACVRHAVAPVGDTQAALAALQALLS